jgi:hypothetical protein
MPLINGRTPVEFKNAPEIKPEQEVFKIPFTNEIFIDNKEYSERLEFYNQKIFSCKITGKSNLTYEEALASETEAAKKLIPEYYIEPIARTTHHSTKNLEDLVWDLADHFKDHYYAGEEVVMPVNARKRRIGTVLKVITKGKEKQLEVNWTAVQGDRTETRKKKKPQAGSSATEEKGDNEEKDDNDKEKEDINKEKEEGHEGGEEKEKKEKKETRHDVPAEVTIVPQSSISRRWFVLSKPVLRQTVKQITEDKHNYTGAPWVVSNEWVEKFGLSKELPKELQELEDKFKNKQNRKRKREEGDTSTNEEGPRKKIKLEVDDMDIERDEKARDLLPPQPSTDFEEPQNCLTSLYMTWSFLTSFSNALSLSPFTVEDYSAALNYNNNCALTAHTMYRVLKLALDTVDSDDTKIKKKNLTVKTWQEVLPQYLKEKKYEFGHPNLTNKLLSKSFFKLDISERLTIIQFLCDEAMNSNAIRDAIIGDLETRKEINKEKSKKLSEIKKQREETGEKTKEKDTKKPVVDAKAKKDDDKAKKEKQEQLKEQKKEVEALKQKAAEAAEKVRLRANPLGLDRYNNKYWWFGKNYNASIVSPTSARILVQYSPHNWAEDAEEELLPYDSDEHSYSSDEEEVQSEHESNSEDSGESSGREARNEKKKAREKLRKQASSPVKSKNNNNTNNTNTDNGAHAESHGFSMADVDPKVTSMKKGSNNAWGYYNTKEELDDLMKFLDTRGVREKQLHATLEKKYVKITAAMNRRAIEVKYQINENSFRRSTRVTTSASNTSAKSDGSGPSFLSYANKLVR